MIPLHSFFVVAFIIMSARTRMNPALTQFSLSPRDLVLARAANSAIKHNSQAVSGAQLAQAIGTETAPLVLKRPEMSCSWE